MKTKVPVRPSNRRSGPVELDPYATRESLPIGPIDKANGKAATKPPYQPAPKPRGAK